jgi:hypothetical protein
MNTSYLAENMLVYNSDGATQPSSTLPGAGRLLTYAAILVISACASAPQAPEGSADVRAKLSALRTNTELATRAPVEIQAAERAVSAAEQPKDEPALEQHLVLVADQTVDIARSWAQTRLYEDQRTPGSSGLTIPSGCCTIPSN